MFRLSATFRIAIGLSCLGASVLIASRMMGLGADHRNAAMQHRAALCQSIAIHATTLVKRNEWHEQLQRDLRILVRRNPDLLSVGLRRHEHLVVATDHHAKSWVARGDGMRDRQLSLPIFLHERLWGNLEFRFQPLPRVGVMASFGAPFIPQMLFVIATCTCLFSLYLSKMFGHLETPKVVPTRVRAALDTFAEGLLVLDRNSQIVLANRAFAENVGQTNEQLQGRPVSDLPWVITDDANSTMPWTETLRDGKARVGVIVDLQLTEFTRRTYKVNSSPIAGAEEGVPQGVLTSFDDVTFHEQRKRELERTLLVLGESRERIQQQNEELRVLATRDPLTGCLNRRSFFESIDEYWQRARRNGYPIACVMVDVDHFKAVNDNYGHSFGDEVLRKVGQALEETVQEDGLVCRYGGEEFCITICGDGEEEAIALAERARKLIESLQLRHGSLTASLGVAVAQSFDKPFQELLEQADRSLYVAKRRGRNRVVCWRDVQEDEMNRPERTRAVEPGRSTSDLEIPFHAVTALISALTYRDARTAEHARRVADRCVTAASSIMSVRDLYVLETAALLHDIGKIGVPDSILLKPGPLNEDEWKLMRQHDRMGVEMIKTTFASRELLEIVECHHAWYGGNPRHAHLPAGNDIPLGARVLAISDAYDAMVTDRVDRRGRSSEEAFDELRRCAGEQFDPNLVEEFISHTLVADRSGHATLEVSKQTALRIGLLMERLTEALDNSDLRSVHEQAKRLTLTAGEAQLAEIAEAASQLATLAECDSAASDIVDIAGSLLDLCRLTQKAYLKVDEQPRQLREDFTARSFAQS